MQTESTDFKLQWRWKELVFCHVIAAALLLGFLWPPAHTLWARIDEAVFFALNGTLQADTLWRDIAAFVNTKLYDKLSTILLILIALGYAFFGQHGNTAQRLAASLFIGLYMLVLTYGRRELGLLDMDRPSPSLVLEPFYNLRDMTPEMKPKIESGNSFPGDHAIAAFIFVSLFWHYAGRKAGLLSLLLIPLFILPRLIGGAHWLSDALVGGGFYVLIVVAWALYTPFGNWCCRSLHRIIEKFQERYFTPWRASGSSSS